MRAVGATVALVAVLVAPVIALAMQPFSTMATLVAGALAAVSGAFYARIGLSR